MMQKPVQVTFRHMAASAAVEQDIYRRSAALMRRSPQVTGCRVVVEAPSDHHRHGGAFSVRLELHLRRGPVQSIGGHLSPPESQDVYLAIREAFLAAEQRLRDGARGRAGSARRLYLALRRELQSSRWMGGGG